MMTSLPRRAISVPAGRIVDVGHSQIPIDTASCANDLLATLVLYCINNWTKTYERF